MLLCFGEKAVFNFDLYLKVFFLDAHLPRQRNTFLADPKSREGEDKCVWSGVYSTPPLCLIFVIILQITKLSDTFLNKNSFIVSNLKPIKC